MSLNESSSADGCLPLDGADDEYEVITSEEVDETLDALEQIIARVTSENIRMLLEEAADGIFSLVYDDEEAEEPLDAQQDEAA